MEREELISIIIPVYNSAKYITKTIESIEKQTYQNYEAIFVEDGSTDESRAILEKLQEKNTKIKIVKLKRNRGVAIARNIGIRKAKGRYLTFLDADDVLVENKLELQKNFIQKKDYELTYGSFRYINDSGSKISSIVKVKEEVNYHQALLNMRLLTITVMIDLKKIPKRYCYMPNVMNEDIATWWKILKKGYLAHGQDDVLAYYRKTKKSRSSQKIKTAKRKMVFVSKVRKIKCAKSDVLFCALHHKCISKENGSLGKNQSIYSTGFASACFYTKCKR